MVQQPTCTGLRVRSTADCNIIFHAVTLGILRMVSRRLSVEERRSIQSGCVFVWEERSPTIEAIGDGLERWTDSRRWGASRLAKEFLLYQEKLPDIGDPQLLTAMFRNRLVKQTYSVFVETPEGRRKWHLVAYCSPETGDQLRTVDDYPQLACLRDSIPEGKYQPARCSKGRTRPDSEPEEFVPGGTVIDFSLTEAPSSPPVSTAPTLTTTASRETLRSSPGDVSLPRVTPELGLRRDPHWVLDNGVDVSRERLHSRNGQVLHKGMPPLMYMRYSPYRPRHPLDNDALRAFDTIP